MNLNIKKAKHLHDKVLQLECAEYQGNYNADMQAYITANDSFHLINELNEEQKFKDFTLDHGVIFWSNGFDIAPEYLFFLANKDKPELQSLFIEWGYK
mgnify:FL=1